MRVSHHDFDIYHLPTHTHIGMEQSNVLSPPELSPLEQEVLEEYERLAENMKKVSG
jgi:hypothetical protein